MDDLHDSILSPYQPVRLAALACLLLPQVERSFAEDRLLRRLLIIEEIPIDLESCKNRVHRIATLPNDGSELDFRIVAPWILAQLKINLRPLWNPSIKVMASLMRSNPRIGWQLVFQEIEKTNVNEKNNPGSESLGMMEAPWMLKDDDRSEEETLESIGSWNEENRRQITSASVDSKHCISGGRLRAYVKVFFTTPNLVVTL